jgi:hypothetical protein
MFPCVYLALVVEQNVSLCLSGISCATKCFLVFIWYELWNKMFPCVYLVLVMKQNVSLNFNCCVLLYNLQLLLTSLISNIINVSRAVVFFNQCFTEFPQLIKLNNYGLQPLLLIYFQQ